MKITTHVKNINLPILYPTNRTGTILAVKAYLGLLEKFTFQKFCCCRPKEKQNIWTYKNTYKSLAWN
jgi:hypothetical protein